MNFDHPKFSGETTVQNAITEVAAMMGENVRLRRGFLMSTPNGIVSTYLHTCPRPGLGRIAGVLSLEAEDQLSLSDALQRVGSELAMHVVAAKPLFLTRELVSSEAMESEREILRSQFFASVSGRIYREVSAGHREMVEGRLKKYVEEVVLMEQKFVVNDSINVKVCDVGACLMIKKLWLPIDNFAQILQTVLNNLSKEVGSSVKIGSFFRMEVGEGIQR
ncbi:Elongation factor Ts, mitochondrial [Vitis vinifera]|uniref:Elongation factor Ts, mitochondrial n=1 Tax=Vitis vinifera TaxID=29760 RepID=A0A438JPN2_VITVI|nr:Elongation factor Ts, mitochondrial [Vitis vinifera]